MACANFFSEWWFWRPIALVGSSQDSRVSLNGTQCDESEFVNSVECEANELSHLLLTILAEMTIEIDSLKKVDWSDERAGWSLEKTV